MTDDCRDARLFMFYLFNLPIPSSIIFIIIRNSMYSVHLYNAKFIKHVHLPVINFAFYLLNTYQRKCLEFVYSKIKIQTIVL